MIFKKILWFLFILSAIAIGFYPLTFIGADPNVGLLSHKSSALLASKLWNIAFAGHLLFGGIALLVGWSLFVDRFRTKNIDWHRRIGKVYLISVLLSAISAFYIAYHATGGPMAQWGFTGMSIAWLITSGMAYRAVLNKNIVQHQEWMIRSYAVTFTGVTFRLWIPLLIIGLDKSFLDIYPIDAWVSWITNLLVAEFILIRRLRANKAKAKSNLEQVALET